MVFARRKTHRGSVCSRALVVCMNPDALYGQSLALCKRLFLGKQGAVASISSDHLLSLLWSSNQYGYQFVLRATRASTRNHFDCL